MNPGNVDSWPQLLPITAISRNLMHMQQPATTPRRTQDPERVFRERVKAGLEQQELAAQVGISAAQMCRIESGKTGASVDVLHRLARVLGCDVADLMPEPKSA